LNLPWEPDLTPRLGVYVTRISPKSPVPGNADLEGLPAVANYGLRPTVEQSSTPQLEVHLLGACPFGDGDKLRVEWLAFLRPERKFSSVTDLGAQIALDRGEARAWWGLV
jgi:riboflavin kinase/FMN adenylyltransferase